MLRSGPRTSTPSGGQALVEFALVFPVFLLVLFGAIDVGRFVFTDSVLSQAAREGARLGSVEAGWIGKGVSSNPQYDASCGTAGGPVCPVDVAHLQSDIEVAANRMVAGIGGTITTVYLSCDPPGTVLAAGWTGATCLNNGQGNVISVRLVYTYNPITPIVGQLIGTVTRTASASMVVN
jgi:TadE-like protein